MNSIFTKQVESAFSFLIDKGFNIVKRTLTQLQYENQIAWVTIEWEPRSGEMNVLFGVKPKTNKPYDSFELNDILELEDIDLPERYKPFQMANENELEPFIKKLADDTRIYAKVALTGDKLYFKKLDKIRNTKSQAYLKNVQLKNTRQKADEAWKQGEFGRVIVLYKSIEQHLNEIEKGKLEYAIKHKTT